VSLVGVWAFHFMILRGVKEAAFINTIVTIAKIVPLILAVLLFVFSSIIRSSPRISSAASECRKRASWRRCATRC
jgi:amino acid transporter